MKIKPLDAFLDDVCVCVCVCVGFFLINFMIFETETSHIRDSLKFNCVANKPIMYTGFILKFPQIMTT